MPLCPTDVATKVLRFVDSPDGDGVAAFWPLVVRVRIKGPFRDAHPNVVLVDIPGVQDANSARGEVVKRLLKDAHGVIVASSIKHGRSFNFDTIYTYFTELEVVVPKMEPSKKRRVW